MQTQTQPQHGLSETACHSVTSDGRVRSMGSEMPALHNQHGGRVLTEVLRVTPTAARVKVKAQLRLDIARIPDIPAQTDCHVADCEENYRPARD